MIFPGSSEKGVKTPKFVSVLELNENLITSDFLLAQYGN